MKIFGIMIVKDEADIVGSTLDYAKKFFDRIIVIDNGSSDATWEIVKARAGEIVVPWKRELRPFSNGFRADAFNAFRHESDEGDWWCYKMDADEFYVDNPRTFLASVPRPYHTVFKRSIDFMLTKKDLEEHDFAGDFETDKPYLRYFRPVAYTEPRFFRFRSRLQWVSGEKNPRHMGIPWHEPITVKHYQWRSPEQIQHRLEVRNKVRKVGAVSQFRHITATDWREVLADHRELLRDDEGRGYEGISLTKRLRLPWHKFLLKWVLHGIGVYP